MHRLKVILSAVFGTVWFAIVLLYIVIMISVGGTNGIINNINNKLRTDYATNMEH